MQIVIDIDENLYTRLFDNGTDNYDDAVDMATAIRKGIPLQESQTGHWVERRNRATGHIESVCSECGAEEGYPYNDYCGNCGARMFEPQKGEKTDE